MTRRDPHPLRDAQIQPAPEPYRVDVTEHTQEVLRRRAQQVHPTMRTTAGRPEWRWGKPVDAPSNSGAPLIMSPSDLEPQKGPDPSTHGSIDDVRRRLKP
jgi:hypothetical protein